MDCSAKVEAISIFICRAYSLLGGFSDLFQLDLNSYAMNDFSDNLPWDFGAFVTRRPSGYEI